MGYGVKFDADHDGISAMLGSMEVASVLRDYAEDVRAVAEGLSESGLAKYNVTAYADEGRAVAVVGTTDRISRCSNAKHNSLLKGVESCGS